MIPSAQDSFANLPFEEQLRIRMASCEGKPCLRPKEMEPRLVKE
jgi:hypothetical protein